jgi:hypothetical protein
MGIQNSPTIGPGGVVCSIPIQDKYLVVILSEGPSYARTEVEGPYAQKTVRSFDFARRLATLRMTNSVDNLPVTQYQVLTFFTD